MALRPTIVPLRLSVDAHADRVVLVAYGAVAALWDDDPRLCVAPQLRFFTGADGLLTGFAIEPFTGFDADALVPSPWGEPRFAVPALGSHAHPSARSFWPPALAGPATRRTMSTSSARPSDA